MVSVNEAVCLGLSLCRGLGLEHLPTLCRGGETISLLRLFHYFPYRNEGDGPDREHNADGDETHDANRNNCADDDGKTPPKKAKKDENQSGDDTSSDNNANRHEQEAPEKIENSNQLGRSSDAGGGGAEEGVAGGVESGSGRDKQTCEGEGSTSASSVSAAGRAVNWLTILIVSC